MSAETIDEPGPASAFAWGWERGEDGQWRERPIPGGDADFTDMVRRLRLAIGGVRHHDLESQYGRKWLGELYELGLGMRAEIARLEAKVAARGRQLVKAGPSHPLYQAKEDELIGWTLQLAEARLMLQHATDALPAGVVPGTFPGDWEEEEEVIVFGDEPERPLSRRELAQRRAAEARARSQASLGVGDA